MGKLQEMIEKYCPDGVEYKTLKYVTSKIVDGSHNVPPVSDRPNAKAMISAKNVMNGDIDLSFGRFISFDDYINESKRVNARRGDVVLTIVGAIGRTAVIETDEVLAFQRSVCVMTPTIDVIDSYYLKHVLQLGSIQQYMNASAKGAAQKGFYLKQVEKLVIPVPPIEVQREIVRLLDAYTAAHDALVSKLNEEIKFRSIQLQMTRDELVSSLVKGAESTKLGDVCVITDGDHQPPPKSDDGVYFVTISCIDGGRRIVFSKAAKVSREYYESLDQSRVPLRGDVLLTVVGTLGVPVLVEENDEFVVQRHIAIIRPGESVSQRFLAQFFQWTVFHDQACAAATGAAQKTIGLRYLRSSAFPMISLEEQEETAAKIDGVELAISRIIEALEIERKLSGARLAEFRNQLLSFPEKEE